MSELATVLSARDQDRVFAAYTMAEFAELADQLGLSFGEVWRLHRELVDWRMFRQRPASAPDAHRMLGVEDHELRAWRAVRAKGFNRVEAADIIVRSRRAGEGEPRNG